MIVDHIVPWARSGGDGRANLAPACWSCNAEKLDQTPDEWKEARLRLGGFWPPAPASRKAEAMVDHYLAQHGVENVPDALRASLVDHARSVFGPWSICHGCGEQFTPRYGGSTDTHCAECELGF